MEGFYWPWMDTESKKKVVSLLKPGVKHESIEKEYDILLETGQKSMTCTI